MKKINYRRFIEQNSVTPAELRDTALRESFQRLQSRGEAHELSLVVEKICALWAFVHEPSLAGTEMPAQAGSDFELQRMAYFSNMFALTTFALHGRRGQYQVRVDYPTFRNQLPGAMSAGLQRGTRPDYEVLPDIEEIARSRAAIHILEKLFGSDGGCDDDVIEVQRPNDDMPEMFYLPILRRHLIWLMLAACQHRFSARELGLIKVLLKKSGTALAEDPQNPARGGDEQAPGGRGWAPQDEEQFEGINPRKIIEEVINRGLQRKKEQQGAAGGPRPGRSSDLPLGRTFSEEFLRTVEVLATQLRWSQDNDNEEFKPGEIIDAPELKEYLDVLDQVEQEAVNQAKEHFFANYLPDLDEDLFNHLKELALQQSRRSAPPQAQGAEDLARLTPENAAAATDASSSEDDDTQSKDALEGYTFQYSEEPV